jgi:hypothetical protein
MAVPLHWLFLAGASMSPHTDNVLADYNDDIRYLYDEFNNGC